MASEWQLFQRRLTAIRNRQRLGRLAAGLIRLMAGAALALGALVLFDRFAALSDPARWAVALAAVAALAAGCAWALLRALRHSRRDAACLVDFASGQHRKPVLTAFELGARVPDGAAGLSAYLLQRSLQAGEQAVAGLPGRAVWPVAVLRRAVLALLVAAGALGCILALQGRDAPVLLGRVLLPHRDIPPVSPYRFRIVPDGPSVVYGGTVSLAVEIDGPPVRSSVWLRTRANGDVHQSACFQESAVRYVQRLENVQQSLDVCFGVGRARSRWQRVRLILQPYILTARATLTPPDYTGAPARAFFVGNEPFSGLPGTRAEVVLTSNRPLLDGSVEISPRARPDDVRADAARLVARDSVAFTWTLEEPAEVRLALRDVHGTPTAAPLLIDQKIVPDKPPEIALLSPPLFALATPDAKLPFHARITDDYGLRRLEWVRALSGYRERFLAVAVPPAARQTEFSRDLDLGLLGCTPGQELEFYMEAIDNNPLATGFAASAIARIRIISAEEYAAMIRARVLLDEFQARFQEAARRMEAVRQALEALEDASPAEVATARAAADAALRAAEEHFRQLREDFAAYDLEGELSNAAAEAADRLAQGRSSLAEAADPAAAAHALLETLGPSMRRIAKLGSQADKAAKAGAMMEQASRFMQLLERQRELTRALARFLDPAAAQDLALLRLLGERQQDILTHLRQWQEAVRQAAAALPPEFAKLAHDAVAFADAIDACEAPEAMGQCAQAAANGAGETAHRWAALALERLENLLKRSCEGGNCMGGLCQGLFNLPGAGDLTRTLKQMLEAISRRSGQGQGQGLGSGAGAGMAVGEGSAASGASALNVPVLGPPRSRPSAASTARGAGHGDGAAGVGRASVSADARSTLAAAPRAAVPTRSATLDAVPEKYREAVRRYFAEETR